MPQRHWTRTCALLISCALCIDGGKVLFPMRSLTLLDLTSCRVRPKTSQAGQYLPHLYSLHMRENRRHKRLSHGQGTQRTRCLWRGTPSQRGCTPAGCVVQRLLRPSAPMRAAGEARCAAPVESTRWESCLTHRH